MDLAEQLRTLEAAQGDPALLALATVDLAYQTSPPQMRDRIKAALVAASVPHWCDRDILAALLATSLEEADSLHEHLRGLRVVESFRARGERAINVHEATRLALREHLRTTEPDRWRNLSLAARTHIGKSSEPHARIETLYHLFAIDQDAAAAECEALDRELSRSARREVRKALSLALTELTRAGWLTDRAYVEAMLSILDLRNTRGEGAQIENDARHVLTLSRKVSHPSSIGRAACTLGDVLYESGRREEGSIGFREYLDVFRGLVAIDPFNLGWRCELAVALTRMGTVFQDRGDLPESLAALEECVEILVQLVSAEPSPAWLRELGAGLGRLGAIYQTQDRLDEALTAFERSLGIARQLAALDASTEDWLNNLATALRCLGDFHQAQNRLELAESIYREYLDVASRMASIDPSDVSFQRELQGAYSSVGTFRLAKRDFTQAAAAFEQSLTYARRLVLSNPSSTQLQLEFAAVHCRVGQMYRQQYQFDQAAEAFGEALAIYSRMASSDPDNTTFRRNVAVAHSWMGDVKEGLGQLEEAAASFGEFLAIARGLVATDPSNAEWKSDLAIAESRMDAVTRARSQPDDPADTSAPGDEDRRAPPSDPQPS